jgi:hypothetical protein
MYCDWHLPCIVIGTCHVHSVTLAIYMNVTTSLQSVVSSPISYLSTLRQFGLQVLAPQPSNINFMEWLHEANEAIQGPFRDGLNSLIMLGAWVLWNHRNRCIFDGLSPNIANFLIQVGDEVCWGQGVVLPCCLLLRCGLEIYRWISLCLLRLDRRKASLGLFWTLFLSPFNIMIRSSPACSRKKP